MSFFRLRYRTNLKCERFACVRSAAFWLVAQGSVVLVTAKPMSVFPGSRTRDRRSVSRTNVCLSRFSRSQLGVVLLTIAKSAASYLFFCDDEVPDRFRGVLAGKILEKR